MSQFQFSEGKSMPTCHATSWTNWYSALISQILTPKSYPQLGVIDIFSVFVEYFGTDGYFGFQICSKNTNSATTLKSTPAQFVHTCALCSTALYSVQHILKSKVNSNPMLARLAKKSSTSSKFEYIRKPISVVSK